ncbi:MAG: anti-sigma factor domain-containing protein [Gammaproteobacteria bacterium]
MTGSPWRAFTIADKRPLPAGVFDVDTVGHNALTVQVNAADPDLFAITVEPAGGLPAPSGPTIIKSATLRLAPHRMPVVPFGLKRNKP